MKEKHSCLRKDLERLCAKSAAEIDRLEDLLHDERVLLLWLLTILEMEKMEEGIAKQPAGRQETIRQEAHRLLAEALKNKFGTTAKEAENHEES
jgi:hypothetical protein